MRFAIDQRVRVKIPGHRTYGKVREWVAQHRQPSLVPHRFYYRSSGPGAWSSHKTDTFSATETVLVELEDEEKSIYRVLPEMLEAA